MTEEEYNQELADINDEYSRKVIDEDEHASMIEELKERRDAEYPQTITIQRSKLIDLYNDLMRQDLTDSQCVDQALDWLSNFDVPKPYNGN